MSRLALDILLYNELNTKEKQIFDKLFTKDNNGNFTNDLNYKTNNKVISFYGKNENNLNLEENVYLKELKIDKIKEITNQNIFRKHKIDRIIKSYYSTPNNKNIDY